MNLEIPEGANVQIIIGAAPPLALTDQGEEAPARMRGRGGVGTTLKFAGIAMLILGAFWVGEQRVRPANAEAGFAAPQPVSQGPSPSQADAQAPTAPAGQVPAEFQAQLQQQPTIQPPPGQNAGSGNSNPFGLQPN